MATFSVSEHGMKKLLKRFSPSRVKRVRIKALKRGQDFMVLALISNSRVDTTHYATSWRRRGSGLGARSVVNTAKYAKYVTHPNQSTTRSPQGGAGAAFIAYMVRKFRPQMRRIVLEVVREEI